MPRLLRAICVVAAATVVAAVKPENRTQEFRVECGSVNDTIQVERSPDLVVFLVTCPSGIGVASITRKCERWASNVCIRLRYDKSRGFKKVEGFYLIADDERPMACDSIQYHAGYAEVRLPTKLLGSNPDVLQVRWVDYYRQ